MKVLFIEKTEDTPSVLLNQKDGIFEIEGRSLPEDALGFYNPVMEWIREYGKSPNESTDLTFKLEYFNSASSKVILKVLNLLAEVKGARVVWCAAEDDDEIVDAGKEYEEDVKIPFEFRMY